MSSMENFFSEFEFLVKKIVKVCTCLVLKKIIRCVAIDSSLLYRSAEKKSAQLPIPVFTNKEREMYTEY